MREIKANSHQVDRVVRPEKGNAIRIKALSPLAYEAIECLSSQQRWPDIYGYISPEQCLLLIERLKYVQDNEDIFPNGKWATIQRLQEIFDHDMWA